MRRVATILLVWSLSPVGTVLNAALFYAVLVSLGARWDRPLPRVVLDQFLRPSFRSFVLANLLANRTGAMPVLFRRA